MNEYYSDYTSNSHRGDYDLCFKVDQKIEEVRRKIAKFVSCEENEVVFTSGDTDSLNLIAYSYGLDNLKKGDVILISEIEHASNVLPWYRIADLTGAVIKFVDIVDGKITLDNVEKAFSTYQNVKIVSFAHISNVLGYMIDAKAIADLCHKNGAIFFLDGAQSVPHIKTNFKELGADFITFSAHKMCGPTGIGALIGKYELLEKMSTFETGGGMNVKFNNKVEVIPLPAPNKFEAGTLNIAGIIGFGAAVDFKNYNIDFLTFSAHKMCGPTGIGALIGKKELLNKMSLFHTGGGMNIKFFNDGSVIPLDAPSKFEAGTLNLSGIMGFRKAVEFLSNLGMDNIHKHDQELFDYAISKLKGNDEIIIYNNDARNGIITFNIKGVFAQDEATLLNSKGIAVRSGQHCAKMIDEIIGEPATVRMSTYLYTTKEDIDSFVDALLNGGDILDAYFN